MDSGSDLQPATIHGASDIPGVPRFESAPPTMGFLTTFLGCTVMLIIGLLGFVPTVVTAATPSPVLALDGTSCRGRSCISALHVFPQRQCTESHRSLLARWHWEHHDILILI